MLLGDAMGDTVLATTEQTLTQSSTANSVGGKQTTKSTGSNMQISTKAIGLGKQSGTMLISYDISGYKKAVESAFKATLPDNVGKVTAIEVVPWVENTEFQSLFKLEEKTVPAFDKFGFPDMDLTDPAQPVQKTKKVMPYEQKRILQSNAEFLAMADRAARAKLNVFYKAKMCRAQIDADYMEQDKDTGEMVFITDRDAIAYGIEITKASYGANCNPKNVDNMTAILAESCNTASCVYPINIATIGDPSPGCDKAYEVEYRCTAPAPKGFHRIAIEKEASGKSLTISCRPPAEDGEKDAKLPQPNVGQTTYVWNNRKPNESLVLEEVATILSEDNLQRLWMEYDSFVYGGTGDEVTNVDKDPKARSLMARQILMGTTPDLGYPKNIFPGASRCVGELFALGISALPYRNIKNCQRIEETFATIAGQRIDDYCMPRFTRVPGQESIEAAMDQEAKAGDSLNRERSAPPGTNPPAAVGAPPAGGPPAAP
jgi:hypothetical protein